MIGNLEIHIYFYKCYVEYIHENEFLKDNQLVVFADDTTPRYVTCVCVLDYHTVAVADKFGNLAVVRLPERVNEDVQDDPTVSKSVWDRGWLNGASQKVFSNGLLQLFFEK